MHIVHVNIHVKPEYLDRFIEATKENARNSIQEPGIVRFDFVQDAEAPTHFVLVEVYRTPEDVERHRETGHYQRWRDAVTDMMAEPRVGTKFKNILPVDEDWKK